MEAVGVFHDEEWESLSKMFACEDSDFLLNSVGNYGFSSNIAQPSPFMADGSSFLPSVANLDHTTNFYSEISQESSNSSNIEGTLFPENGQSMHYCCNNDEGLMMAPVFSDDMMQEILQLKTEVSEMGFCNEMQQLKRKYDETPQEQDHNNRNHNDLSDQSPKKKARRRCREAQKTKKESRKKKKTVQISNDGGDVQSSITCSSEEEDDSNGKGKATRGTATDAQSIYARRRRERINERLRILQNLVPNGTKVDISTMLEEAVHYVKFLQLQIKLLSSDQMWMYAPIAYNGMDMGLYHKIMPNLWP